MGMMRVGIIGWRGMVGSVLVDRMREEGDFDLIDPVFFSTTQAGSPAPAIGRAVPAVKDAKDLRELADTDALISCQGGDYTNEIYPAASRGRLGRILDRRRVGAAHGRRRGDRARSRQPGRHRPRARRAACSSFIGGNCTVSLMLMAMAGLFCAGPGRVDHHDDVSGSVRRRRPADARARRADGLGAQRCAALLPILHRHPRASIARWRTRCAPTISR